MLHVFAVYVFKDYFRSLESDIFQMLMVLWKRLITSLFLMDANDKHK